MHHQDFPCPGPPEREPNPGLPSIPPSLLPKSQKVISLNTRLHEAPNYGRMRFRLCQFNQAPGTELSTQQASTQATKKPIGEGAHEEGAANACDASTRNLFESRAATFCLIVLYALAVVAWNPCKRTGFVGSMDHSNPARRSCDQTILTPERRNITCSLF